MWGKGHWAKNPGLMLKYRAASECIRLACPEVLAGIKYTPEEVSEFTTPQVTVTAAPQPMKEPAKDPAGAEKQQRTVQSRMKALGLNGARFKEFTERALGTSVGAWKSLDADDQATVLAALDEWESTGVDPTIEGVAREVVDGELVETTTGEITKGGEQA